jgi:hypothetical protein
MPGKPEWGRNRRPLHCTIKSFSRWSLIRCTAPRFATVRGLFDWISLVDGASGTFGPGLVREEVLGVGR